MPINSYLYPILFSIFLNYALINCQAQQQAVPQAVLADKLLEGYDKRFPPKVIANVITVEIALVGLADVAETSETVTFKQLRTLGWQDDRMRWNPAEYGGLSVLTLPAEFLWLPEITSPQINELNPILDDDRLMVQILADGKMVLVSFDMVTVKCEFNVKQFPSDTQTCVMNYTSTAYPKPAMILKTTNQHSLPGSCEEVKNPEWNVIECSLKEGQISVRSGNLGSADFSAAEFVFKFQRKSGFYTITQTCQAAIITFLSLVGLFTPSTQLRDRNERVTMGLTALLALSVVLGVVSDRLPRDDKQFPILGTFVMLELSIVVLATLIAVGIMYLHSYCLRVKRIPAICKCLVGKADKDQIPRCSSESINSLNRRANVQDYHMYELRKLLHKHLIANEENDEFVDSVNLLCFRLDLVFLVLSLIFNALCTVFFIFVF